MQTTSAALLISIALVVFGIAYYYFTTRHKERMAIIENGLAPNVFKSNSSYFPFILMLGIICIGIAIGMMVGIYLMAIGLFGNAYIMPLCICLFLGLSLVLCYFLLLYLHKKQHR